MSLKTCDGDHLSTVQCDACDEDAKRCDDCWEENPQDIHDDLRDYRRYSQWNDGRPEDVAVVRLCKRCYSRARAADTADGRGDALYDQMKDEAYERAWARK